MPRVISLISASIIFLSGNQIAMTQTIVNASVNIIDRAANAILPNNLVVEKLASGFKFTEGPLWTREGYLIFSDIPSNKIYRLDFEGKTSVYLENSGYLGSPPKKNPRGSNGITYDKEGNIIFTQHGDRAIVRLTKDKKKEKIVDSYQGKRLNSPNDLVVKSDGAIYFTDPPYGLPKLNDDTQKEQKVNGVYRYYDGNLTLLASDLIYPNGLAFSPDEQYLYVGSSDRDLKVLMRYRVQSDGTLTDAQVFARTNVDGMKVDTQGNLYLTTPEGLKIFSATGKQLATIKLPEEPANLAWGGLDYRSLYLTARTSIYRIAIEQSGIKP